MKQYGKFLSKLANTILKILGVFPTLIISAVAIGFGFSAYHLTMLGHGLSAIIAACVSCFLFALAIKFYGAD